LNQLNYFDPIKPENAEIKRNVKQGTVDILLKLKEKGKQSISLTGGISGISGAYIGLTYQTNNFLGLGETLTLSGNVGTIQKTASFGFTEPYLFDRPISTGFTIFTSSYNFDQARQTSLALGYQVQLNPNTVQNYTQNSDGFTLFASYPIRHLGFTRVGLTYGYSITSIKALSTAATALFDVLQFQSLSGPSSLDGIHSSHITPTLTYNTVDNPVNPTHGKSLFASFTLTGGPIGGNVNTISQVVEAKYFRPNYHRRNVIAMRVEASFQTGFDDKVIPPFSRYYLGGEDTLRGFDERTVSPVVFIPQISSTPISYQDPTRLSSSGSPLTSTVSIPTLSYQTAFPGGDTMAVVNLEYRIPIAPHVSISLFGDAGATGALRQDQLQPYPTYTSMIQTQFPAAGVTNTLQFQPGTNFKLRASTGVELVIQLPIVQAPFRIYWAYNPERMAQVIAAPRTEFPGNPLLADPTKPACTPSITTNCFDPGWTQYLGGIPPEVWNSSVVPEVLNLYNNPQKTNFFDPVKTFRFTVSRTF
jgi:outer membrane protein insertion porin family